jgi:hypothetical protein
MPVQGTQVNASSTYSGWVLTPDDVREFMRDFPDRNILVDGVEFEDKDIERAIRMTIDMGNAIARPTSYTETTFPNRYVLQMGVCSYLLKSEGLRQLRNEAMYQDGNIQPVGLDNKQQAYAALAMQYLQEFTQMLTAIKVQQNLTSFGSMSSPIAQSTYIR